jgi:hypothetical protein
MASILPSSTSQTTRIVYPGSRLVNSNIPTTECLFLKFTCKEWENLAVSSAVSGLPLVGGLVGTGMATSFAQNPDDIYSGMSKLIADIRLPAPKQIQSMTKIKYVDDTNIVQGMINDASQVGSFLTDFALALLPGPWSLLGTASAVAGKARDVVTGRRDLDATDSMFHSAEKRAYNLTFTLISTNKEEARQVASISNIFQALSLPQRSKTLSLNIGAPYANKAYPPPLWRFGIGLGLGGNVDISWLGQTSFCVLQSVSVNTAAAGSPYMVNDPDTGAKPMMTSFSLMFIDYEPVYRDGDSYRVVPRSAGNNAYNGGV